MSDIFTGVTIRKINFIEKSANSVQLLDPIFLFQLKGDISQLLAQHKSQNLRVLSTPSQPQAMILVRTKFEAKEISAALGDSATFIISDKNDGQNLQDFTQGKEFLEKLYNFIFI